MFNGQVSSHAPFYSGNTLHKNAMNTSIKKKRLNLKAVCILTIAVLAVGGGSYVLHAWQVQQNAAGLLDQAHQFKQDAKGDLALKSLEQYLGMTPEDNEALVLLGDWLDEEAKTPLQKYRALLVLKNSLRREDSRKVRGKVARLEVQLGLHKQALDELQKLLETDPNDAEVLNLLAQVKSGLEEYQEAATYCEKAIAAGKDQVDVYEMYAYVLLKAFPEKTNIAERQIQAMVKRHPKSLQAHCSAARFYLSTGDFAEAKEHADSALQKLPTPLGKAEQQSQVAELFLLSGRIALAQGKLQQAQKQFETGLKHFPDDNQFVLALARLHLKTGTANTATDYLKTTLKNPPKQLDQLFTLIELMLDTGQTNDVSKLIAEFKKLQVQPVVDYFDARLAIANKADWAEAAFLLERVRSHPMLTSSLCNTLRLRERINVLLGDCYGQLHNPDQQINAYRRVTGRGDANWLPAQKKLADMLASRGALEEALEWYDVILPHLPEATVDKIELLVRQNLQLPAEVRNWKGIEKQINGLSKEARDSTRVMLLQASVFAARGKWQDAKAAAVRARDKNPKSTGPWLYLISLAEQRGASQKELRQLLDEAEQSAGRKADWHLLRAKYAFKYEPKQVNKLLARLRADLKTFDGVDRNRLLLGLGHAFLLANDIPSAQQLWTTLAKRQPDNLSLRFRLVELAARNRDSEKVQHWLDEIKRREGGNGPFSSYVNATLFVLSHERKADSTLLRKALDSLEQAENARPTWSRVFSLRGLVYDLQNEPEKALAQYEKAIQMGDRRAANYKRTLTLMRNLGQISGANELLRQLPQTVQTNEDFYRLFTELTLLEADSKKESQHALEVAEKAITTSTDYLDYVWLGQVCAVAGASEKAETAFRTAREMAEAAFEKGSLKEDDVSTAWVIYLAYLASTDERKAREQISVAASKLSANQLPMVLAPTYEKLGDLEKAEAQYQASLKAKPADPKSVQKLAGFYTRNGKLDKAEPLLRKLLDQTGKTPTPMVHWARRNLAMVLARKGTYRQFLAGLELLEKNKTKNQLSVLDQQVQAAIQAQHPAHRIEALKTLKRLANESGTMPPTLQFHLARLHSANGDWQESDKQMQALLLQEKNNPVFLTFHIRLLLHHKEAFRALQQVNQLKKIHPKSFDTVQLQARALHANNRGEEAVRLLSDWAASHPQTPLHKVAMAYENIEADDQAEKMYSKFVETSGHRNKLLVLAKFYHRQNKLDKALDVCEQARTSAQPAAVGLTAVEMVHKGTSSKTQVDRVKRWIREDMQRHPKDEFLPILQADLLAYEGKTQDAIRVYESMLAKNSRHPIALNNLAYLLAFQPGKQQQALQMINKAIDLAGPMAELLDTRAVIHLQRKHPTQAIRDLEAAIIQGHDGSRHFHLAQACVMDGEYTRGKQEFDLAVRQYQLTSRMLPPIEQAAFAQLAESIRKKSN